MNDTTPSDHASKVPRFGFGDTLERQEAELAANPLLERFAASRRALAADPHRPRYHFVSPEGKLNDPNGLCFWQGRWHLFYQGYPPEDPRQHWGHAVSEDLVHWRDLPYAIYPDPEYQCYSGATLVEPDRVIAMYHGTRAGNMVAVSSDPLLLNWRKIAGRAVIPIARLDGSPWPYRVFDPCIWKKDGVYYALSGGTQPHLQSGRRTRADALFRSCDLESWEYLHEFVEGDRFSLVGDDGACPYFWPIGERHMLLFFSHMSGGQYLLGDYDRKADKFLATSGGKFNFGAWGPAGVHAPSATPDGRGGLVVISNMNPGKPTAGWDQIMTLPRRLTLEGRDDLHVSPAGDVESLRREQAHVGALTLPANREVVLPEVRGNVMEIEALIDTGSSPMVELCVLRSPGREEVTRVCFYRERGFRDPDRRKPAAASLISIDSSCSSTLPDATSRAPETAPVPLEPGEPLRLRVFLDRSVVEVFANGRQCAAVRVYPGREDAVGVSLRAQGSAAELRSLDAWQLGSV